MAKEGARAKLSTTVDARLLDAVNRFVASHPETNRGMVLDEALRLWASRERERALEAQYAAPQSAQEQQEREDWRHIQRAAAARLLNLR